MGYEPKVKKQTIATLIDINRVYLQVFMGFGFLAFMPGHNAPAFVAIANVPLANPALKPSLSRPNSYRSRQSLEITPAGLLFKKCFTPAMLRASIFRITKRMGCLKISTFWAPAPFFQDSLKILNNLNGHAEVGGSVRIKILC